MFIAPIGEQVAKPIYGRKRKRFAPIGAKVVVLHTIL